jgi:hypothetical protein
MRRTRVLADAAIHRQAWLKANLAPRFPRVGDEVKLDYLGGISGVKVRHHRARTAVARSSRVSPPACYFL